MAVIAAESSGKSRAVSKTGAQGLMQLEPATARDLGVTDAFDPAQNIIGGIKYLRQLLGRYKGNVPLALSAYNLGMGAVDAVGGNISRMPLETQQYVKNIVTAAYGQRG